MCGGGIMDTCVSVCIMLYSPAVSKRSVNPLVAHVDHGMVALINNVLEIYDVPVVASLETTVSAETAKPTKVSVVDGQGHRYGNIVCCSILICRVYWLAMYFHDTVKVYMYDRWNVVASSALFMLLCASCVW